MVVPHRTRWRNITHNKWAQLHIAKITNNAVGSALIGALPLLDVASLEREMKRQTAGRRLQLALRQSQMRCVVLTNRHKGPTPSESCGQVSKDRGTTLGGRLDDPTANQAEIREMLKTVCGLSNDVTHAAWKLLGWGTQIPCKVCK